MLAIFTPHTVGQLLSFYCDGFVLQIALIVGNTEHHLLNDLIVLLRDDCTDVLKGVVTNLPKTLTVVCGPLTSQAMHEAKVSLVAVCSICLCKPAWMAQ